jgi:hypothetical protein
MIIAAAQLHAAVFNLKVLTDASPDYSDLAGMIYSITDPWQTPQEKCWAMFYFNHIARRQTSPMIIHGLECTDPIRQFNDYGYTMCSTVAGINCAIWDQMGLPVKFWDISNHTVSEVFYDNRWHIYDNSMSALYTLCDGTTIAAVQDVGKSAACPLSDNQSESGHIAQYHCLTAGSIKGFLTGADCARDLQQEYRCFNPNGLKYRNYYFNWDKGHRYILNLRQNETYTRNYSPLGDSPAFYVPNNGKDPDAPNKRYHIRGNGLWTFHPQLTPQGLTDIYDLSGCTTAEPSGIIPQHPNQPSRITFKINGANVITSLAINALFSRLAPSDLNSISISTTNGMYWRQVWTNTQLGETPAEINLVDEVNGSYEVLIRVELTSTAKPADASLKDIRFTTVTMLNSKTQPRLLLGQNTIYIGAGDQTDSTVCWPDLQADNYKPYLLDSQNIASRPDHPGYMGVLHPARPNEDAFIVFKTDAPRDIRQIHYGGRFYNRARKSHIDMLHSFDDGRTWHKSYSLTDTTPPWDVIHYETVSDVPPRTRSVLFKYLLNSPGAGPGECSIYSLRTETDYAPKDPAFTPLEVTFNWSEPQTDYSLRPRSHNQLITDLPFTYTINTGGADHPIVNSLQVNLKGARKDVTYGYSDNLDTPSSRYTYTWTTCGNNLAQGKTYRVSTPSKTNWNAGDPQGTRLTDGVIGPNYAGGTGPGYALCWDKGDDPVIDLDLNQPQDCAAFRIHLSAGWPWWDALKGEVKDTVEVLTSNDNRNFVSQGFFTLNLRRKDIPINHMMPDDETATGFTYDLIPDKPVNARYVRFKITPQRTLTVSEVQVLDTINQKPFPLPILQPPIYNHNVIPSEAM